jgi:hypothetical protein
MSENTIEYQIPCREVSQEVILDRHFDTVKLDVYWDSDEGKIYTPDHPCQTLKDKQVKIVKRKRILFDSMEDEVWDLYLDGVLWKGNLIQGYTAYTKTIRIDAPWGAG